MQQSHSQLYVLITRHGRWVDEAATCFNSTSFSTLFTAQVTQQDYCYRYGTDPVLELWLTNADLFTQTTVRITDVGMIKQH